MTVTLTPAVEALLRPRLLANNESAEEWLNEFLQRTLPPTPAALSDKKEQGNVPAVGGLVEKDGFLVFHLMFAAAKADADIIWTLNAKDFHRVCPTPAERVQEPGYSRNAGQRHARAEQRTGNRHLQNAHELAAR